MILLDTHVVAWLALDPTPLSRAAKSAIDEARKGRNGVGISGITLLELATLAAKGRLRLNLSLESFLREIEAKFVVLPIDARVALLATAFPATYPKDPADRVIGATALAEGLPLVTADREIRRSKALRTIW